MNSPKIMHVDNLYSFGLVRYEPSDILLLDKRSRLTYTYHELPPVVAVHPDVSHPYLLRPILYKNAAIFLQAQETLDTLLEHRRRDYTVIKFTQE